MWIVYVPGWRETYQVYSFAFSILGWINEKQLLESRIKNNSSRENVLVILLIIIDTSPLVQTGKEVLQRDCDNPILSLKYNDSK